MLSALDPTLVGAISGTLAALILAIATTVTTLLLRKADRDERAEVRKEVANAATLLAQRQDDQIIASEKVADLLVETTKETTEKLDKTIVQGEATHLFLNSQDTENKRRMLVLTEALLVSLKENRVSRKEGGLRAQPGISKQIKVLEADIEAQKKEISEREIQTKKADAKVEAV